MKKVTAKHFYSFDSATLIRAFNDEAVIRDKLADSGAKDVNIQLETREQGFSVVINRNMPADAPAALKSVLGEWNAVQQTEVWQGDTAQGFECELQITIEGVPASISGTMAMSSVGMLTTNQIDIEVSCGIPLLGGTLEKFVASSIEKSVAQEFAFLKAYLG